MYGIYSAIMVQLMVNNDKRVDSRTNGHLRGTWRVIRRYSSQIVTTYSQLHGVQPLNEQYRTSYWPVHPETNRHDIVNGLGRSVHPG